MYSTQQIETALALYQRLKSITNVCKCLGYPTFGTLANWIDKYAAQEPDLHLQRKTFKHASWQTRQYAVRQRLIDKRTLHDISQEIGYSQRAIIRWCNRTQQ